MISLSSMPSTNTDATILCLKSCIKSRDGSLIISCIDVVSDKNIYVYN